MSLAAPVAAVPINVTLDKPVTITGDVGVITCCFPDASTFPPAPLSSLVDGVYLTEGTNWQDGTVWWDERHPGSVNNVVEIDGQDLRKVTVASVRGASALARALVVLLVIVWLLSWVLSYVTFDVVDPRSGEPLVVRNMLSGGTGW